MECRKAGVGVWKAGGGQMTEHSIAAVLAIPLLMSGTKTTHTADRDLCELVVGARVLPKERRA